MKASIRRVFGKLTLPAAARDEQRRDAAGLPAEDPGNDRVLPALMAWLARAQDCSASNDGGVARDFSLIKGWATSYPETTGYIIPTMLEWARRTGEPVWRERALRMTDWLVSIQFPEGGFQGGKIDSTPVVPVTFNTGQILLGLAAAEAETGRYRDAMTRAADWLVRTQDADGCWRSHGSPFADADDKQYETHVAWGLFEAARIDGSRGWGEAGLRNVRWALAGQAANGWFPKCCLSNTAQPLTHTLGYALRGVLEAWRFAPAEDLLYSAERTARGLLGALSPDGFLPGCLGPDWSARATWACLTGTVQVAHSWLLLWRITGRAEYLDAGRRANAFVRRSVRLDGPADQRGGVKGSFPVDGDYGQWSYLNWAPKFAADSLMLESDLARAETSRAAEPHRQTEPASLEMRASIAHSAAPLADCAGSALNDVWNRMFGCLPDMSATG